MHQYYNGNKINNYASIHTSVISPLMRKYWTKVDTFRKWGKKHWLAANWVSQLVIVSDHQTNSHSYWPHFDLEKFHRGHSESKGAEGSEIEVRRQRSSVAAITTRGELKTSPVSFSV